MCLFMSERELWKLSCKLLPVFQAIVTNHPSHAVLQKAREYFTVKSLNFLTKRWTLVVLSSTWWIFWISISVALRDILRGLSVRGVMDLKHASPATHACGLFCLMCKGDFAPLQIGLTESEPLPWKILWVHPDHACTLSGTPIHSEEAELKIWVPLSGRTGAARDMRFPLCLCTRSFATLYLKKHECIILIFFFQCRSKQKGCSLI